MKKKYQIAAIIFIILSCVFGYKTLFWGRICNCVSCVIFLIFTILFLVHSYKEKHDSYRKTNKLFSIGIVLGFITLIISPFINGITSFRPTYAYKHYYISNYLNHEVFPEKIPTNASDIQFRILGEGISRRVIYTISFKTDEKTLNELRQNAASLAYSVSLGTIEDNIPKDVSPDFLKNEDVSFCTVYRIKDEYDNEIKIFISNSEPLICYYQE